MRPENKRMQEFLKSNGVLAAPKYIAKGSMRGSWRLSNQKITWNDDLCNKLTSLGFKDFDCKPLGKFSGNGGYFHVFVRGHNELV